MDKCALRWSAHTIDRRMKGTAGHAHKQLAAAETREREREIDRKKVAAAARAMGRNHGTSYRRR